MALLPSNQQACMENVNYMYDELQDRDFFVKLARLLPEWYDPFHKKYKLTT